MKIGVVFLVLVFLHHAEAVGQQLDAIIQQKPKTLARSQEPIPEYIDPSYKSLILLDYKVALDTLTKMATEKELPYYQAWCHYLNGQIFEALAAVNSYLKQPLANPYDGQILLGRIELGRDHRYQAIEAFDRAISMEPKKPYAYLEKSKVYALTLNQEEGLGFVNKSIKQFPGEVDFYVYRALLLADNDNPKKAIVDFNVYLNSTLKKDTADLLLVYFGLTKSYLLAKDYPNALVQANKGLALFPNYFPGYGLRGEAYYRLKDYDLSMRDIKKMEEEVKNSYYWKIKAEIYEIKGDRESACVLYNDSCRLFLDEEACSKARKLKCKTDK